MGVETPTFGGKLSQVPLPKVLYRLSIAQQSGKLNIVWDKESKNIFFKKGLVTLADSNSESDHPAEFLSKKYNLPKDKLSELYIQSESTSQPFEMLLIASGLLSPADFSTALEGLIKNCIHSALLWTDGEYKFFSAVEPDSKRALFSIKVIPLLAEAVRSTIDETAGKILLSQIHGASLKAIENPMVKATELNLTAREMRIYGCLREHDSVTQAIKKISSQHSDITELDLMRVIYLLNQVDLIAVTHPTQDVSSHSSLPKASNGESKSAPPKTGSAKAPAKSTPPAKPAPSAKQESKPAEAAQPPPQTEQKEPELLLTKESLTERAKQSEGQNHFEILGVPKEASDVTIKKAYLKLARVFHPDTVRSKLGADEARIAEEYFARVSEAYQVISSPQGKADYLAKLKLQEEGSPLAGKEVNVNEILKAEEMFYLAKKAIDAGAFKKALENISEAIKISPDEKEYKIYLAWTEFNLAPESSEAQEKIFTDMKKIVDEGIRTADSLYYFGYMNKIMGRMNEAEKLFRLALQENPKMTKVSQELRLIEIRRAKSQQQKHQQKK